MLRVLDLFSGIGGFSLGLERTGGFRTVAFCEIDPYCRIVLGERWPGVPVFGDIRQVNGRDVGPAEVICGGFPCQDISHAGRRAGIEGERSGLWSEYARLIGEVRPSWVIVENVAALLNRGIERVLGDMAALGYDAEWHCIPASFVGAPHRRDRIWIIAYPDSDRRDIDHEGEGWSEGTPFGSAIALGEQRGAEERRPDSRAGQAAVAGVDQQSGAEVAYAEREGLEGRSQALRPKEEWRSYPGYLGAGISRLGRDARWLAEPDVGRVADGVPARVDRLRALGNAVVPQIPELIGRAILDAERDD